jgi:hypothetical protein
VPLPGVLAGVLWPCGRVPGGLADLLGRLGSCLAHLADRLADLAGRLPDTAANPGGDTADRLAGVVDRRTHLLTAPPGPNAVWVVWPT